MVAVTTILRRLLIFLAVYLQVPFAYYTAAAGSVERVAPLPMIANHVQDALDLVALDLQVKATGIPRNATAVEHLLTGLLLPGVFVRAVPNHSLRDLIENDWKLFKDRYAKAAIPWMTQKTSWWHAMVGRPKDACLVASYAVALGALFLPFSRKTGAKLAFSAAVFFGLAGFGACMLWHQFRPSPQFALAFVCGASEYYVIRRGSGRDTRLPKAETAGEMKQKST